MHLQNKQSPQSLNYNSISICGKTKKKKKTWWWNSFQGKPWLIFHKELIKLRMTESTTMKKNIQNVKSSFLLMTKFKNNNNNDAELTCRKHGYFQSSVIRFLLKTKTTFHCNEIGFRKLTNMKHLMWNVKPSQKWNMQTDF